VGGSAFQSLNFVTVAQRPSRWCPVCGRVNNGRRTIRFGTY
jgi:hypothetical protein